MIELYYIRGINTYDTPLFNSYSQQRDFFDEHRIKTITDNSFYPPYYKNTINVSDDDVQFTTRFNYLSFTYLGRHYYYFIDKIEYITDGLITLHITMDTIQTFMLDITFVSSQVSRRLINRWDSTYNQINRNYLRENLSEGINILNKYENLTDKERLKGHYGFILAKVNREKLNSIGNPTRLKHNDTGMVQTIVDDAGLIMIPACDQTYGYMATPNGKYAYKENETLLETVDEYDTLIKTIHYLSEKPEIVSMYYLPQNPFADNTLIETMGTDGTVLLTFSNSLNSLNLDDGIKYSFVDRDTVFSCLNIYSGELKTYTKTINFDFVKSTSIDNLWNVKYVPQMVDENYIQINFGERSKYTTFPLSVLSYPQISLHTVFDAFSGNRIYWITDHPQALGDDYLTTIICDYTWDVTMWNDYWLQYQATHKGTLSIKPAYETGKFALSLVGTTKTKGFLTPVRRKVSAKGKRLLNESIGEYSDYVAETATNNMNLQYSPETIKQTCNYTSSLICKQCDSFYQIMNVTDLEDVAKIYEGYGYAVHENYASINLFRELNTRYYYNVIKCDYLDIAIQGTINDQETLDNIKQRFYEGLRLWNVETPEQKTQLFIPFVYDNVEKEFIE